MKTLMTAAFAAVLLCAGSTSFVQAQDSACEGEIGAAYGLCNAYCEAMDCDALDETQASDKACAAVLANFGKITGREIPPCGGAEYPQQYEECTTPGTVIPFGETEGYLYGCESGNPYYHTYLYCEAAGYWVCVNPGG